MRSLTPQTQQTFFWRSFNQSARSTRSLVVLVHAIPSADLEAGFSVGYAIKQGRPSLPIPRLVGLLMLKQLENLSNKRVVLQFKQNPYFQYFCGEKNLQTQFTYKLRQYFTLHSKHTAQSERNVKQYVCLTNNMA